MKYIAFTGTALIIASGGYVSLYGRATTAKLSNGSVAAQLLLQGLPVANPEFVQFHPTAMVQGDKPRLISESVRGEGGRLWVPRNGRPWYFLEEMYPELGNLVPRDLASRAIYTVVEKLGLGIDRGNQVYLDITHLPKEIAEYRLSNVIDLYKKFSGDDARKVPMKVYPAPHYSMGGIYVDSKHRTEFAGIYACGECDFMYHGGNRLGGNSLLSATYSGYVAAKTIMEDYQGGKLLSSTCSADESWILNIQMDAEKTQADNLKQKGKESVEGISKDVGKLLTENAGMIRNNDDLKTALLKMEELKERVNQIELRDQGPWANSSLIALRKLRPSIALSQAILSGALARNESRGSHYKPEFPGQNDKEWLKTTIVRVIDGKVSLSYKPVETSLLPVPGIDNKEREGASRV